MTTPLPTSAPLTVSVRALCAFTARSGDLDLRFTPAPSALEGMESHRLVQGRRGDGYEAEVPLSGLFQQLTVRGRADGFDANRQQLEEIKTYRGQLDGVRPHQRALHWAQARVYGHLLCQARGLTRLQVALVYVQTGTGQETELVETHTAADLQAHFEALCARYLAWAHSEQQHRQARDAALAALTFPHGSFRAGQRELAVAVYRNVGPGHRDDKDGNDSGDGGGRCLLAQAPTGIGKTLGTLFPLLQASARKGLDKLFFLTAKGTGHALALDALARVHEQLRTSSPIPPLRVLDVLARDKVCEHPDKACHGESCPLAQGFYDRLPAARQALAQHTSLWDGTAMRTTALAHGICPYYLAQEMAHWCDVAVADYHYFYDSAAMLYALTVAHGWKVGVLVDEAHNLPDRARRMYTAELHQGTLADARAAATGPVRKALDALQRQWNAIHRDQVDAYCAHPALPDAFVQALQRAIGAVAEAQTDAPLLPGDPVLALYLDALHFAAMAEQFGSHALLDVTLDPPRYGRRGHSSTLCIRNVVPAPHLAARHAAAHSSVLFSGTLTPPTFYRDLLGLPAETGWVDVESPFHSGQLAVHTVGHLSTRFADRAQSLAPIAHLMAEQFARLPGNYLCFASSFDYLQRIAAQLQQAHPEVPQWQQTAGMDDAARQAFLDRFQEGGQGIGFAVLGGAFSEGVDLPGHRLIGAFIATLGLPQVNPVNEEMRRAMDRHFGAGKGYDYTYLFPGLRKVVQAAGRVIRTEQDQGVVFLIDDRYRRAAVRALLPGWWALDRAPPHQPGG